MRCLLCAVSWHPISACMIYQTVFTCPLCREEPHAVPECRLYAEWVEIRRTIAQRNEGRHQYRNRNEAWNNRQNQVDQNARTNPRGENRQHYAPQQRSTYPEMRQRFPAGNRDSSAERRREPAGNYEFGRRSQTTQQGSRPLERLPAYREPFRYTARQGNF